MKFSCGILTFTQHNPRVPRNTTGEVYQAVA